MPAFLEKKEYKRTWRKANRDKENAYMRAWRTKNPEKAKALGKRHYKKQKDSINARRRQLYAIDPIRREKHKSLNLSWYYGIGIEEYKSLNERQNGLCAICSLPQKSKKTDKLYVDHNHQTGQVRALLCQKCNSAIGLLGENLELMKKIINYLETYACIS